MVIIQLIFLAYLLYTAEKYLVMKISSREHRLLPVILVLAGLYNFYRVVECVTDASETFALLEQLLILQALFGVIHYKRDFLHMKFLPGAEVVLFVTLVLADISMILCFQKTGSAAIPYHSCLILFLIVLLIMNSYIRFFMNMKKREKMVGFTLFSTFLLVVASLFVTPIVHNEWIMLLTPLTLFIVETQLNRLMKNGYIVDSTYLLKDQLFDNAAVMTVLFDEDCYLIDSNEAARQAVLDSQWNIEISPTTRYVDEINYLLNRLDSNEEVKLGNCFYRIHIAKQFYMNRLRGYVVNLIDLTEEMEENILMESLKKEAESAAKLKGRFLASMSHELRSPLHAIIGYCDILNRQEDLSDRYHKMISSIKSAGDTLLRLVNSILDYSKMEAGKLDLKHEEYDFQAIFQNLLLESLINRKTKPIEISVVMDTPYPHKLIGDELRVWDIIQNLMSNAVKYTAKGSITCTVSCDYSNPSTEAEAARTMEITIRVADTGSGMSEELIEKVFDEYESFAADKLMEGTGLGLNIVKQTVEMLKGSVKVISDGCTGTEFVVNIYQECQEKELLPPRVFKESDVELHQNQSGASQIEASSGNLQMNSSNENEEKMVQPEWLYPDAKILCVDDMEVNLNLFQEFTDIWHITVDTTDNAPDAIDMVRKKDYDIIFLDNMMPVMKGTEAASIIRTFSDVPIYILTADISQETKDESIAIGATGILDKPLKIEALKNVLETKLPEKLRTPVHKEQPRISPRRIKILKTYVKETNEVAKELRDYWEKDDIDNFRIKVHGIKGTSRGILGGEQSSDKLQLIEELADLAEAMEMAAKLDNKNYIERHIDELEKYIQQGLALITDSLEELDTYEPSPSDSVNQVDDNTIHELFVKLKDAFDSYNIGEIEANLDKLEASVRDDRDKKLVAELRECADQLDYEEGSQKLEI